MDQPKLERLLRLMKLLTANTTYNVDQLAERLQMSRRTVYRYIDTFREAGFVIKKSGDCIRLDKESPHFRDISQLVHFTEEEAVILKNAIENIDDTNMLKQNLKRKLYSVYDNKTLADTVVRGKNAPNIRTLIEAIDRQQQAVLHSYQSPHGGEVRDRRVEPFAFTTNYVQVWCYDPEAGACKLFKTSRIGSVELTGEAWKHEAEHREGFIDVFRMHGGARHRVQLELGLRFTNNTCFGLYVHICCLIERLVTRREIEIFTDIEDFAQQEAAFIQCVKHAFSVVEEYYGVEIPVEEIGYIFNYVDHNDG